MQDLPVILLTLFIVYVTVRIVDFLNVLRGIRHLPGRRFLFSHQGLLAFLMPKEVRWLSAGHNHMIFNKYKLFEEAGCDIISMVSVFPSAEAALILADAEAIKEVSVMRTRFPKPIEQYTALGFYGPNLVVSEANEWKRYRKICAPAFSDKNNRLVWNETIKIVDSLFKDVWGDQKSVTLDHSLDMTMKLALFVIGVASFGMPMSWTDDKTHTEGREMSFIQALQIASTEVIWKAFLPGRVLSLTKNLRRIEVAFKELRLYILDMIHERQASPEVERADLLSSLLLDRGDSSDIGTLSDEDLIGNIYIFLLAGHETTAHTLCFAFALLALYPDEQEKLYDHIKSVVGDRIPTHEDMNALTHSMAVFNEALRLFPPATYVPKQAAEDTTLTAGNRFGEKRVIPVPKGTTIVFGATGVHYNPRYWEDPHAFKPSRFLKDDWPRDAFIPFSTGARSCIGRRFAETEGVAALTLFIQRYKIAIKEEPQFAHETFEERKARILTLDTLITITPTRVPLVFTRRD